ncbi:unnamed protein product, partial [Ectocarpus sp. 8 AP-2014]
IGLCWRGYVSRPHGPSRIVDDWSSYYLALRLRRVCVNNKAHFVVSTDTLPLPLNCIPIRTLFRGRHFIQDGRLRSEPVSIRQRRRQGQELKRVKILIDAGHPQRNRRPTETRELPKEITHVTSRNPCPLLYVIRLRKHSGLQRRRHVATKHVLPINYCQQSMLNRNKKRLQVSQTDSS